MSPVDDTRDLSALDQHVAGMQITVQPGRGHVERGMECCLPDLPDLRCDVIGGAGKPLHTRFNPRSALRKGHTTKRVGGSVSGRWDVQRAQKGRE
jgi:hypothetical protein